MKGESLHGSGPSLQELGTTGMSGATSTVCMLVLACRNGTCSLPSLFGALSAFLFGLGVRCTRKNS